MLPIDDDDPSALDDLLHDLEDLEYLERLKIPLAERLWIAGIQMPGASHPDPAPNPPPCASRRRVASEPLCGYDVTNGGEWAHAPWTTHLLPCRRVATHVVRYWQEDFGDLYVCALHLRALIRRNPDDAIEAEPADAPDDEMRTWPTESQLDEENDMTDLPDVLGLESHRP